MNSESRRKARALFALASCVALAHGCVRVDVYPSPRERGTEDAGPSSRDGSPVAPEAASDEACRQCVAGACDPEWKACQDDPDCLTCLYDPLGSRCQASEKRHDFRNCACATTTGLDVCPTLCPTPASTRLRR